MEAIIKLLIVLAFMFLGSVLSTLCGAFTGWFVGLFFGETILAFLATLGITGFKM